MSYVALNLGGLPGVTGGSLSQALAVNGDGTLVVGYAFDSDGNQQPVYWDAAGTIHQLETLSGGGLAANSCSVDGTTIVGLSDPGNGSPIAVMWTGPSWTLTNLGALAGSTPPASAAVGCSATGFIIAGQSNDATTVNTAGRPCVWVNGGISSLPLTGGTSLGNGAFCSADGNVIVGNCSDFTLAGPAAVWTGGPPLWGVAPLPRLGASVQTDQALACSFNGQIIVGNAWDFSNQEFAVTWTPDVNKIGGTYGGAFSSANGCDASGTYIVGNDPSGNAVVWISLAGALLPLFSGQTLGAPATAISFDATTIVGAGIDALNRTVAVRWSWSGAPPPPLSPPPPPPPPSAPNNGFFICGNDWTIAQPMTKVYGLDHLIGQHVVGLADGAPVGPLLVQADGSVTLPFSASYITLGLSFTVQLQTPYLDIGNPTIQGRRKDITAATVRVDASAAPMVGSNQPDGGSFTPTQVGPPWTNLQPAVTQDPEQFPGTYLNPAGQLVTLLFSGDFRANLQPGWDERGQIAVQQTLPLPLSITSVLPELLQGDLPEQVISPPQGGQGEEPRGPGTWMLNSRSRR